jgi:hypothetical protein
MRESSKALLHACAFCAALILPLRSVSAAATDVCLFEENQNAAYYVLGSQVQPQSNVLVVGDCGSSYAALNSQYLRTAGERMKAGQTTQVGPEACQPNHTLRRGCSDPNEERALPLY